MLEKVAGNINVAKLRAILLLEIDFNALNKIVFNGRAIPRIETAKTIPYDVIGRRRGQSSFHIALNKKLVCDIGNQQKKPTVMVSADATNYYDRIAHSILSMAYQHFDLQLEYLLTLFRTMQTIKMFLHTSFSISSQFCNGSDTLPFQGGI